MPSCTPTPRKPLRSILVLAAAFAAIGPAESFATQVVYLNFDRRTGGSEVVYTPTDRDSVQTFLEKSFEPFDFNFVQTEPTTGEYSTLFFNDGPALGIAEGLDFRNLNRSDNALVNINEPLMNGSITTPEEFIRLSSSTAAHELGHLVGLRHRDSFGPIGSGIDPSTFSFFLPRFDDDGFLIDLNFETYPGPQSAAETLNHIMESDGFFVENTIDQYFGARETTKLAFNEQGNVLAETPGFKQTMATAQPIELSPINVPNLIERGELVGAEFFVNAVAVTGRIGFANERDFYSFEGAAGQLINVEVISAIFEEERYDNEIDSIITLYDSSGEVVDYYGVEATNDNEFESTDSVLIDLFLPEDDTYFIEVSSFETFDTGNYELFIYDYRYELTTSFLAEEFIPFDLNGDLSVNAADYTVLQDLNGQTVAPGSLGDFDNNGKIDELDIEKWQLNYGATPTLVFTEGPTQLPGGGGPVFPDFPDFPFGSSVPEPATALMALAAVGVGLGTRRRA